MKSMIEKGRERWRETAQGNAQEKKKKRHKMHRKKTGKY